MLRSMLFNLPWASRMITTDAAKFSEALTTLYSNFAKPLLDLVIFNLQLQKSIGTTMSLLALGVYSSSTFLLRLVSPNFGKMAAREAKLEVRLGFWHMF